MLKISRFIVISMIFTFTVAIFAVETSGTHADDGCPIFSSGSSILDGSDYWFQLNIGPVSGNSLIYVEIINRATATNPTGELNGNMYWLILEDTETQQTIGNLSGFMSGATSSTQQFKAPYSADINMVAFSTEATDYVVRVCHAQGGTPLTMPETPARRTGFQANSPGSPLAVYAGTPGDSYASIYAIDPESARGHLIISLTYSQIDSVGIPETGSVLLAETMNPFTGGSVALFRLSSGWYQINTSYVDGKAFTLTWNDAGESEYLDW